MKVLTYITAIPLLILSLLALSQGAHANDSIHLGNSMPVDNNIEQLYSSAGYPYDMLINRAGRVKINYRIEGDSIACLVSIEGATFSANSPRVFVPQKNFKEKPLASCLSRVKAKAWLSRTFTK